MRIITLSLTGVVQKEPVVIEIWTVHSLHGFWEGEGKLEHRKMTQSEGIIDPSVDQEMEYVNKESKELKE